MMLVDTPVESVAFEEADVVLLEDCLDDLQSHGWQVEVTLGETESGAPFAVFADSDTGDLLMNITTDGGKWYISSYRFPTVEGWTLTEALHHTPYFRRR